MRRAWRPAFLVGDGRAATVDARCRAGFPAAPSYFDDDGATDCSGWSAAVALRRCRASREDFETNVIRLE